MPDLHVSVRWPDGSAQRVYSPSTVVREHLAAGSEYELADFVARSRIALEAASERVRERYGMRCTSAAASLVAVERAAQRFPDGGLVRVEAVG